MTDVLQVITDTDRRGAQVFAADLTAALAARGRSVKTVALVRGYSRDGLTVPWLGKRSLGPKTLFSLRREMRNARVVVAHGSRALPATVGATVGAKTILVYKSIGDPLFWANTPARRARVRMFLQRTSVVVALWQGGASTLVDRFGVPRERLRVIPNGIRSQDFPAANAATRSAMRCHFGIDESAPIAVYIGSLSREKNVASAIEAIGILRGARLLVVGQGHDQLRLESLADRLAPRQVRFIAPTGRPADVLAAADALVLPSATEGMPRVVIEAGMVGVPVVATSVGGVSAVVRTEDGKLVAPNDSQALADALRLTFEERKRSNGTREHYIARYDIDVVATAWDNLFAELGAWERAPIAVQ